MKRESRMPEDLWKRFTDRFGKRDNVVALRFLDGSVIRDVAVRMGDDLLGYFGLTRWIRRTSERPVREGPHNPES